MIFDKKSRKLHQTGSSCISVRVNDRDTGPKVKWTVFEDFDETSRKEPQTGSGCISVTVIDRDTARKLKLSTFDGF